MPLRITTLRHIRENAVSELPSRNRSACTRSLLALSLLVSASASVAAGASPPSAPNALSATAVSDSEIQLSWEASEGDRAIRGYAITFDGAPIRGTGGKRYRLRKLLPATTYRIGVFAHDGQGSSTPATVVVTTMPNEEGRRSEPGSLTADILSHREVRLSWDAPDIDERAYGYNIMIGGKRVGRTRSDSFLLKKLLPETAYDIDVVADYGRYRGLSPAATTSVKTPAAPGADPTPLPDDSDTGSSPSDGGESGSGSDGYPDGATGTHPRTGLPTHAPDGTPYCD